MMIDNACIWGILLWFDINRKMDPVAAVQQRVSLCNHTLGMVQQFLQVVSGLSRAVLQQHHGHKLEELVTTSPVS